MLDLMDNYFNLVPIQNTEQQNTGLDAVIFKMERLVTVTVLANNLGSFYTLIYLVFTLVP